VTFFLVIFSNDRVFEHLDPEEPEIKLDKALWPLPLVPLVKATERNHDP
jgi:hypothetical protein